MSAAELFASLDSTVGGETLIVEIDEHFATVDKSKTKLGVLALSGKSRILAKFHPGPGGKGQKQGELSGWAAFVGETPAPGPGLYKLTIENNTVKLSKHESEVWSGRGKSLRLDGIWEVILE